MLFFKWPDSSVQANLPAEEINSYQKHIIEDMLGVESGWMAAPLVNSPSLLPFQKYYLLCKAINQNKRDFLLTLDQVFEHFQLAKICEGDFNKLFNEAEWFVSLKHINDLAHNHEVKYSKTCIDPAFLFYFRCSANAIVLTDPYSSTSVILKKAVANKLYELLKLVEPNEEHEIELQENFQLELSALCGDHSWRGIVPLPFDQQKGLLLYWLDSMHQTTMNVWAHTAFCWQVFWEAAEYYSAQTGCASFIDDYESRQQQLRI